MNIHKMIAELQAEKQRLDEAISALERLSAGKHKRRGRPQDASQETSKFDSAIHSVAASKQVGH